MMKYILHFLIVISILHNVSHLINAMEKIIRQMQHSNSSEMHEKTNMIWVEVGNPSLTSEIIHYYPHHGHIPVKEMREMENGLFVIFVPRFEVLFIIAHV